MKKIDYKNLNEIVVKTQDELDSIPLDFEGKIYVEFGTYYERAIVKNKYNSSVEARENSSVEARGNSSVEARENSSVVARENSSVVAWENSSVVAWENSSVVAWENSSVEARGNSQIVDHLQGAKIKISGNARIVYLPKTIFEFMDFYGVKHTKNKGTFYKAVHKEDNYYTAHYVRSFKYKIGNKYSERCNQDVEEDCGSGIHIAHLNWALDFGKDWKNLAILEVETKISNIVLPKNTDGKVRTCEIKVLREVPLNECGLYGKMIEKRNKNANN